MENATIIPEDYDGLLKEYHCVRKELEIVKQDLYGCKRQLKVTEALRAEYQNEIESLLVGESDEKQKLEVKINNLEETISNIRLSHAEQISNLEFELLKKTEEIEALQSEMIEVLKHSNNTAAQPEEINKFIDEIISLKDEIEILSIDNEELKESIGTLQKKNVDLDNAVLQYKEELACLKENLKAKKEELLEANQLVEKLNDELCCTRTELESLKCKPLDQHSKGNSLFAEVDDRRVYLQKTINSMKTEYIQMKQERLQHLKLISSLKKENASLCDRWKADVEEIESDRHVISRSLKNRIEVLEMLVEKYRKEMDGKNREIKDTFSGMEYFSDLIEMKDKEIRDLEEKLSSRSLSQTVLSVSLAEANKEIRKWRQEAILNGYQTKINKDCTSEIDEEVNKEPEWKQHNKTPNLPNIQTKIYESERIKLGSCYKAGILKKKSSKVLEVSNYSKTQEVQPSKNIVENIDEKIFDIKHKETTACVLEAQNNAAIKNILADTEPSSVSEEHNVLNDMNEEKENIPAVLRKTVNFSEDTKEPKVTDRRMMNTTVPRIITSKLQTL